jgi:site-specific DNA-methyltransferase (adenine-specific)
VLSARKSARNALGGDGVSVTVLQGDCREVFASLEDGHFGSIVTDPPYGVGLQYASWDDSFSAWKALMDETVPEMLRVASGPVVVFGANPTQYLEHMLTLKPDRMLVWNPSFSMAQSRSNGMFFRWHPIFCWRLPKKHQGPSLDVLRNPCDGRNWWKHPGTKPLSLMVNLLGICIPDFKSVCDPYCGSGTTLVAAKRLGVDATGIELDEGYCEIARRRVAEEQTLFESGSSEVEDESDLFAEVTE